MRGSNHSKPIISSNEGSQINAGFQIPFFPDYIQVSDLMGFPKSVSWFMSKKRIWTFSTCCDSTFASDHALLLPGIANILISHIQTMHASLWFNLLIGCGNKVIFSGLGSRAVPWCKLEPLGRANPITFWGHTSMDCTANFPARSKPKWRRRPTKREKWWSIMRGKTESKKCQKLRYTLQVQVNISNISAPCSILFDFYPEWSEQMPIGDAVVRPQGFEICYVVFFPYR